VSIPSDVVVWLDGAFVTPKDARVSLFDRGYLFGDSVFATMRAYHGRLFRAERHFEQLRAAAHALGIAFADDVRAHVDEAVARLGPRADAIVRVTASRGPGPLGMTLRDCDEPTLSIVVRALSPYPAESYAEGIPTTIVGPRRIPPACLDPSWKTGNLLPQVLARRELEQNGMIEGIQLGIDGAVASGTIANLFLVRGGELVTPDVSSGARPGVTRAAILEQAATCGLSPVERRVEPSELDGAEEAFFTSTVMECLPIRSIASRRTDYGPPGPSTRALASRLRDVIAEETA
jgi:branched-chain amino acid aminotransferase